MISRHAFGSRLRTQREGQGVTLESIVESTKIKRSLLVALERGDASQWPRGLYRRAYIRNYAGAIGVPAEPLVAEFVGLFPEDGSPACEEAVDSVAEPMRLTLAVETDGRRRRLASHAVAAGIELAVVVLLGAVASFATGWSFVTASGAAALIFYPIATAVTGRVLSPNRLRSLLRMHPAGMGADAEPDAAPLYLVSRQQPAAAPQHVAVGPDEFAQPRTAAR